MNVQWSLLEATWHVWYYHRLNVETDTRIHVFSIKPDIKELWKKNLKSKGMLVLSWNCFVLETIVFKIILLMLTCNRVIYCYFKLSQFCKFFSDVISVLICIARYNTLELNILGSLVTFKSVKESWVVKVWGPTTVKDMVFCYGDTVKDSEIFITLWHQCVCPLIS